MRSVLLDMDVAGVGIFGGMRGYGYHSSSIIQYRGEPALYVGQGHSFTAGIILYLVFGNIAEAEVFGLGMAEIPAAHGGGGVHGETFRQVHAGVFFYL